jgi:hypothetical protein
LSSPHARATGSAIRALRHSAEDRPDIWKVSAAGWNIPVTRCVRYTNKTNLGELTPMATTTDYDAPRGHATDVDSDSIEELKARRTTTTGYVDIDDDAADGFELPSLELADEELSVAVVPMRTDEFRCSRCFLVHHRSQRIVAGDGSLICRECA